MSSIRAERGQSSLELCIMLGVILLAMIALQRYVKYAFSGRIKSSADSISQTLLNPHNSDTTILVDRKTQDKTGAFGFTDSDAVFTNSDPAPDLNVTPPAILGLAKDDDPWDVTLRDEVVK